MELNRSNKRITIEIAVLGVIYELVTTLRGALHLSRGSRSAMAAIQQTRQPNYVLKTQNSNQHHPAIIRPEAAAAVPPARPGHSHKHQCVICVCVCICEYTNIYIHI